MIEFLRIASLDGDLVKQGAVLDGVHVQVELLTLPAVTDQVALVRSDHNVLELLILQIMFPRVVWPIGKDPHKKCLNICTRGIPLLERDTGTPTG